MDFIIISIFILFFYMHIETRILSVKTLKISDEISNIKILHISDVHISRMFVSWSIIKRIIKKKNPDFIAFTGDYIENKDDTKKFLKFLKYINPNNVTSILVWGNHEHKTLKYYNLIDNFKDNLNKENIVLYNENKIVTSKSGKKAIFIGIDDLGRGTPDINAAFNLPKNEETVNLKKIVLSHNPDIIFDFSDKNFDIMLSGHFHGGQIYMPFRFEFKMLRSERLCKMGIYKGLNKINGKTFYISRGLGNVMFPLRFISIPEITIFEL